MTDTTKTLDLDALQRLCDAAAPGPWVPIAKYPHIAVQPDDGMVSTNLAGNPAEDAAFMAAARDAVPALVAEVRRLRVENGELRRAVGPWVSAPTTVGHGRCPRCGEHRDLHPTWQVCPPCAVAEGWEVA